MQTGCFGKTLHDYVGVLVRQSEYVESVHASILIFDPHIYEGSRPSLLCKATGGACNPGCGVFDPSVRCTRADLSLNYQTFVQAFWLYRSKALMRKSEWSLFYDCFHPKPAQDEVKKFEPIFPNDVPHLSRQEARSNYDLGKNLDPSDPCHWSKARLSAATSGSELERRMAATDWDWNWYAHLQSDGVTATLHLCKEKNKFDKMMFDEFKNDYDNTGSYSFKRTHKDFLALSTLYKSLKHALLLTIEFTD